MCDSYLSSTLKTYASYRNAENVLHQSPTNTNNVTNDAIVDNQASCLSPYQSSYTSAYMLKPIGRCRFEGKYLHGIIITLLK